MPRFSGLPPPMEFWITVLFTANLYGPGFPSSTAVALTSDSMSLFYIFKHQSSDLTNINITGFPEFSAFQERIQSIADG
jgi:hypothetical protein